MKGLKYKKGVVSVIVTILFIAIITFVVVGTTSSVSQAAAMVKINEESMLSLIAADASQEDVIYRLREAMAYDNEEVLELNGSFATTTISDDIETGEKIVNTIADHNSKIRKRNTRLIEGESISFNFGVQVGQGGFEMYQSSSVTGNVYSGGSVYGDSSNVVRGTVVSSGPDGLVDGIHGTSSVHAHTIQNSTVEGDAHYTVISNTSVWGDLYPDSEDEPYRELPISDETIEEWKQTAADGGTSTDCDINTDATIGPVKFDCAELIIRANADITIEGMIWVEGNFIAENNVDISIDPSLGKKSIAIIADDPSNRTTGSVVTLDNNVSFSGTGDESSQVLVISGNTDEENDGSTIGIDLVNNNSGDLSLYCNHCRILIRNNALLSSVTAFTVEMRNNAELIYEDGIASSVFETGPGSSWEISETKEVE